MFIVFSILPGMIVQMQGVDPIERGLPIVERGSRLLRNVTLLGGLAVLGLSTEAGSSADELVGVGVTSLIISGCLELVRQVLPLRRPH